MFLLAKHIAEITDFKAYLLSGEVNDEILLVLTPSWNC